MTFLADEGELLLIPVWLGVVHRGRVALDGDLLQLAFGHLVILPVESLRLQEPGPLESRQLLSVQAERLFHLRLLGRRRLGVSGLDRLGGPLGFRLTVGIEQGPNLVRVAGLEGRLEVEKHLPDLLFVLGRAGCGSRRAAGFRVDAGKHGRCQERRVQERRGQGSIQDHGGCGRGELLQDLTSVVVIPRHSRVRLYRAGRVRVSPTSSCISPSRSATASQRDRLASVSVSRVAFRFCSVISTSPKVTCPDPAASADRSSSRLFVWRGSTSRVRRSTWTRAAWYRPRASAVSWRSRVSALRIAACARACRARASWIAPWRRSHTGNGNSMLRSGPAVRSTFSLTYPAPTVTFGTCSAVARSTAS